MKATPFFARILATIALVALAGAGPASSLRAEEGELFPNGSFEQLDPNGNPIFWGLKLERQIVTLEGHNAICAPPAVGLAWEAPAPVSANAEYLFKFRVKSEGGKFQQVCFWACRPDQHEPSKEGLKFLNWNAPEVAEWTWKEVRFQMPAGVTRFRIFFNGISREGPNTYFTDFSLKPTGTASATPESSPSGGAGGVSESPNQIPATSTPK